MEGLGIQVLRTLPLQWSHRQETLPSGQHKRKTPILTVDDSVAGHDSVEINRQGYVALAELPEGEALEIVPNTA